MIDISKLTVHSNLFVIYSATGVFIFNNGRILGWEGR